jgi:hypothetical protein
VTIPVIPDYVSMNILLKAFSISLISFSIASPAVAEELPKNPYRYVGMLYVFAEFLEPCPQDSIVCRGRRPDYFQLYQHEFSEPPPIPPLINCPMIPHHSTPQNNVDFPRFK